MRKETIAAIFGNHQNKPMVIGTEAVPCSDYPASIALIIVTSTATAGGDTRVGAIDLAACVGIVPAALCHR